MFIMPAAPHGCQIVFTVDSCAMMALNSAVQWIMNEIRLLEATISACDKFLQLFIGVYGCGKQM